MRNKHKLQTYKKVKLQQKIASLNSKIKKFEQYQLSNCNQVCFQQAMQIAETLKQILVATKGGIVLSAPQIGIYSNVFVIRPIVSNKDCKIIINPLVKQKSKQLSNQIEGCLSFPGYSRFVKRPSFVTIQYTNYNNQRVEQSFPLWESRCILCGLDSLVSKSQLRKSYDQNDKNEKLYVSQHAPIRVQHASNASKTKGQPKS